MRKKTAIALGCAAALLGLSGLLLIGPHTQAQTTTDQTEKTTKKKRKKSAKSTEAPPAAATPAPAPTPAPTPSETTTGRKKKATAETAEAEKTTRTRKSKKSATEVPSQSFVPPGITPKAEESAPPVKNATRGQVRSAQSNGMVWVNTDSGIYHKGGRWYGNTKQGKFMTEDEAVKAGYRAAQNEK